MMSASKISTQYFWQWLSRALLLSLAIWCLVTFRQHGISNDEYVQHTYGQLLLQWYQSGFTNTAAFHFRNLYLYGGLFDLIAAALETSTHLWVWDMRHLLSAAFGWLGFLGVFRLASLIGGPRLGVLSMLLLFLTFSWSGAMFTHTKDIPFATCMLWASYAMVFVVRDMESTQPKYIFLLGLAIGSALGVRIGGAFAVIELCIALTIALYFRDRQQQFALLSVILALIKTLVPAALVAFVIMAVCWPWSVSAPGHILEAVHSFSHFAFSMETIANGHVYKIGEVSRSYLFQYLAVKLPEVACLGLLALALLSPLFYQAVQKTGQTVKTALLVVLVCLLFPLVFVLYDRPALYNGVRHFTFVLPWLVILSACGLIYMWTILRKSQRCLMVWVRFVWLGVCIGLSMIAMADMVALHPYEYMRLNRFAGSPQASQFAWEGDYWISAMREVAPALTRMRLPEREQPYLVAVCAETQQGQSYLDPRFQVTKDWVAADFFISGTNMHCHDVLKGKVIGQVYREGMLLAVIKDRRSLTGNERLPSPAKN